MLQTNSHAVRKHVKKYYNIYTEHFVFFSVQLKILLVQNRKAIFHKLESLYILLTKNDISFYIIKLFFDKKFKILLINVLFNIII